MKVKMNSLEIVLKAMHLCKASESQEAEHETPHLRFDSHLSSKMSLWSLFSPLSLRADTEEDHEEEELRPLSRDELQKTVLTMVQ